MEDPDKSHFMQLIMRVYLEANDFELFGLQTLCVLFLEASVTLDNVLVALQNAADMNVEFLKVGHPFHTSNLFSQQILYSES